MISELWDNPALQLPIVSVLESLGRALDVEFKPFLPQILPSLLKIFEGDLTEKRQQTQTKIFNALLMLGSNVEEYMHLIIPIITRTFERTEASTTLRKSAVLCIEGLSRRINFAEHASRVLHPLVRTLGNANFELRNTIMETICSMVCQLGSDFAIFVPTISKVNPTLLPLLHSNSG
jgi:FKBP12-rapamycin complex-associated protein